MAFSKEYYEKLEADIAHMFNRLRSNFSPEQVSEVEEFLQVGECGLAFETLCEIVEENDLSLPKDLHPLLRALAEQMGIEHQIWINLV